MCVCAINGLKYIAVNSIWHVLQRVMISGVLLDKKGSNGVENEVGVWVGLIWEEVVVIFVRGIGCGSVGELLVDVWIWIFDNDLGRLNVVGSDFGCVLMIE